MNFRDRPPHVMGSGHTDVDTGGDQFGGGNGIGGRGRGGRGRFRGGFRGGFRRGDGGRNMSDRPSPWKDNIDNAHRFDHKNAGGFRGSGHFGSFNDNRDMNKDVRDFGSTKDASQQSDGFNARGSQGNFNNKWQDVTKLQKPTVPAVAGQTKTATQRTNDVEIIVTHKLLTEYAEFIERRLKSGGFNVDLLFPNEEVPLGRVLGNIAGRGTLYALVVTQLNEERRSVTVNILHGQTQEHRNMPLDDALTLITKNFEAFSKGERVPVISGPGAVLVTPAGIPLGEKHPETIQSLLNILVENRPLNSAQYEKLIGYLQDKRDKLLKNNSLNNSSSIKTAEIEPQNTQADLQNRILNTLRTKLHTNNAIGSFPSAQPNPSIVHNSTFQTVKNIVQNQLLGRN